MEPSPALAQAGPPSSGAGARAAGPPTQERVEPATILGTVTDTRTGAPLAGVFVAVLDRTDERRSAVLTDQQGRFVVRAPSLTSVRLRAERIGLETVFTDFFQLEPGQVRTQEMGTSPSAVTLQGVEVTTTSRRCSLDGADGTVTVQLWEEARKALEVAQWADDVGFRYQLRRFRRTLDPDGRTLAEDGSVPETLFGQSPFSTLPADTLMGRGFVVRDPEGWSYFGPDAALLLSDAFLSAHCFRAVQVEDVLGLEFEPAPTQLVPDITGTLWFDSEGLLDRIVYRYVNMDADLRQIRGVDQAGGEVRFALIEGGAWIVRDWSIRMPRIRTDGRSFGLRIASALDGFDEVGGEVRRAEPVRGTAQVFGARSGALRGRITVGDSAVALPGAQVFLSGTGYTATTSTDGSFLMENIRPGRYDAVVEHPARRALGLSSGAFPVEITANEVAVLEAPLLGQEEALRRRCDRRGSVTLEGWEERNPGAMTILAGSVRVDGEAAVLWPVRVRWAARSLAAGAGGAEVRERWSGVVMQTQDDGVWLVCDLPLDVEVQTSVAREWDGDGRTEASGDELEIRWTPWRSAGRPSAGDVIWLELSPAR